MQTLAIAFFLIAALLSAPLLPNKMNVIPLLVLSGARAIALAAALLFRVASGRVDSWGSSRFMLGLMTIAGVVSVTAGCFLIQTLREDEVPVPWPVVYRVTAGLLPILLAASAFLPSRKLFLIVAAVAPVVAVLLISTWKPLNVKYYESFPKSSACAGYDNMKESRCAAGRSSVESSLSR